MQKNCAGKKRYFAPDSTMSLGCEALHQKQNSGTVRKRERAPRTANNNALLPHVFTEENLKDLTGWKKRKTKRGRWQHMVPCGKPRIGAKQGKRSIAGEPINSNR